MTCRFLGLTTLAGVVGILVGISGFASDGKRPLLVLGQPLDVGGGASVDVLAGGEEGAGGPIEKVVHAEVAVAIPSKVAA